jgi:hypothetical protein
MATASEAVDAAYQQYLGRPAGATGKAYWEKTWESDYQKAINEGKTTAQAEAAATAATNKHLAASTEGKVYDKTGIAKTAIEGTAGYGTIDDTADWYTTNFTADDPNEYATGMRDEDWSAKLSSSNLENYTQGLNKMYGEYQGNTLGQEGLEWWGYQKTQAIDHYMSDAGGNYSFDTASKLADFSVSEDIKANTGHQNYKKFGSIGYGNPLEIKTGVDDHGDITTKEVYLNLDPSTNLNPTGTKQATQYQIDADGEFVLDDDGNKIATGNTATPYSWQYVPDATAPGGYKITPVSFDTGVGGSVVGHDYHMDNYISDHGGKKTFQYPTTGLENVDASQFTLAANDPNKLSIAQWAETPGGKAAIANNQFGIKNQGFTVVDGKLVHTPSNFDHTKYDSNLGLAPGQNVDINWGGGYVTGLSGGPVPTGWVPPKEEETMMMGGAGGGNTIINLDQTQKSTTAADKALKIEDRAMASGQGRRGFSTNKYQPTGNIRTLGIV